VTTSMADLSLRYHLKMAVQIILARLTVIMEKYKLVAVAFFIGTGFGALMMLPFVIQINENNSFVPTYSSALDSGNPLLNSTPIESDTIETEIVHVMANDNHTVNWNAPVNSTDIISFEFGGHVLNQSVSIASFQCSLDSDRWAECESPFVTEAGFVGQHSIDIRALDSNDSPDHTPASWVWNVTK